MVRYGRHAANHRQLLVCFHAACAVVWNTVFGTCLALDGHLRDFCRGRVVAPCDNARNAPWREHAAPVGTRIALVSRTLPASELATALLASGCPRTLAAFVAGRAHPSALPFTCPICREDCDAGAMSVDLECSVNVAMPQVARVGSSTSAEARAPQSNHLFCPPCIAASLHMRPACPLCMRVISIADAQIIRGRRVHPLHPAAVPAANAQPQPAAISVDIPQQQSLQNTAPHDTAERALAFSHDTSFSAANPDIIPLPLPLEGGGLLEAQARMHWHHLPPLAVQGNV